MGTHLLNSLPLRNKLNRRIPTYICGNPYIHTGSYNSYSYTNQNYIASHMIVGISSAIFCAVLLVTFTYSLAPKVRQDYIIV